MGERFMAWTLMGVGIYIMHAAYKGNAPWQTFVDKGKAAGKAKGKSGGGSGTATAEAIDILLVDPVTGKNPPPVIAPPPAGADWTDDLYGGMK